MDKASKWAVGWRAVSAAQQRVNSNTSGSLLWGCVVYSCLSSLSLSSTSPAIEPSSPPPSPPSPSGNAHFLPLAPPRSPAGRRGGGGAEEEMLGGAVQCHSRMCARAHERSKKDLQKSFWISVAQERGNRGATNKISSCLDAAFHLGVVYNKDTFINWQ